MKIGVLVSLKADMDAEYAKVASLGLNSCQVCSWEKELQTREVADGLVAAAKKHGVSVSTFWCGYSGPKVWNFIEGPTTLGLLPPEYRAVRTEELCHGSEFAKMIGVKYVATHAGFIPENPSDPEYPGMLAALKKVADTCFANGQKLIFETGQETPVTLLRVITALGADRTGINLDPANLLMYGKANPVDAVDMIGQYVCDVHAKDGEYPTDGNLLGVEKALGQGRVNFPKLVAALKNKGYDGALTIEREIEGDEQTRDIINAIELLKPLI